MTRHAKTLPIIPVILSGGSGTRLWPLSRKSKPKQFLNFGGHHSLLQQAILRCRASIFDPTPICVGAKDHHHLIGQDLKSIQVDGEILLEPVTRNSCAAIIAGCLRALERNRDAMVLILAADHIIHEPTHFTNAISAARPVAEKGCIVTFGIRPDRPATEYGYIDTGDKITKSDCFMLRKFVEKPSCEDAQKYIKRGYLWNSGNLLFRATDFIKEVRLYQPQILKAVETAFIKASRTSNIIRLEKIAFEKSPSISVDYGIMEHTKRAAIVPVDCQWTDIGSWQSVWEISEKDKAANVVIGGAHICEGSNNLVYSPDNYVTLFGLNDISLIAIKDTILVSSRRNGETIKQLVGELRAKGRSEADQGIQIFKSWGYVERVERGKTYQILRMVINAGATLKEPEYFSNSGHWIIVEGNLKISQDGKSQKLNTDQLVHLGSGDIKKIANPGKLPAILITVKAGKKLQN